MHFGNLPKTAIRIANQGTNPAEVLIIPILCVSIFTLIIVRVGVFAARQVAQLVVDMGLADAQRSHPSVWMHVAIQSCPGVMRMTEGPKTCYRLLNIVL